ncbi:hypothetical protein D9M68_825840 [compost metagenome]
MYAHTTLRQLQHARLTHVDLQAVVQQFALDALLMFAALRQLIGATTEKDSAAECGADEAGSASLEHDGS